MSIKEKFKYVWNVVLGPDYTDSVDIEKSDDPNMKELKDSLNRVKTMEQGLSSSSSNNNKAGKGKSSKVVETVSIDLEAVKAAKVSAQKQQTAEKEQER